jgi:hypothetical protein
MDHSSVSKKQHEATALPSWKMCRWCMLHFPNVDHTPLTMLLLAGPYSVAGFLYPRPIQLLPSRSFSVLEFSTLSELSLVSFIVQLPDNEPRSFIQTSALVGPL